MEKLTFYLMWAGAIALVSAFVFFGYTEYSSGKRAEPPKTGLAIKEPGTRLQY